MEHGLTLKSEQLMEPSKSKNKVFIKNNTPRKCKAKSLFPNKAQMQKASSLHNIDKVSNPNYADKEKSDEPSVSELRSIIADLENKQKMILLENKRLTEMQTTQIRTNSSSEVDYRSNACATISNSRSDLSDADSTTQNISDENEGNDYLSKLSVSTLQERIQEMEKTNYSATEEIQATMSELEDLQHSLRTFDESNNSLLYQRHLLIASLCEQTENLKKSRRTCDILKILLCSGTVYDKDIIDDQLQELYSESEEKNRVLNEQNYELKARYSELEEKYDNELKQRQEVQLLLSNHSKQFVDTVDWTDCRLGVLALQQQISEQKQLEMKLKAETVELTSKVCQMEASMCRDMLTQRSKEMNSLTESEYEIQKLSLLVNVLREKYAVDIIAWRQEQRDLLMSIAASTTIIEEKGRKLQEVEKRLEISEERRKQLEEAMKCQMKNSQVEVLAPHDHSSSTHACSVKQLIQGIEKQMEVNKNTVKPHCDSQNNENKPKLSRTDTSNGVILPLNSIPDKNVKKSSTFKVEVGRRPLLESETPYDSILKSLSRRDSVIIDPKLEHHVLCSPTESADDSCQSVSRDLLAQLVKQTNKGSKRNALLHWCQSKTNGYPKIDITNFSSSWDDGLAMCALLHSLYPTLLDYNKLADDTTTNPDKHQKLVNFQTAFEVASQLGIESELNAETMVGVDRPNWSSVMNFVTQIYIHFVSSTQSP